MRGRYDPSVASARGTIAEQEYLEMLFWLCVPGAKVTILRLENEAEDLLHYLKAAGIEPGLAGEVASNDGETVSVRADAAMATVTASVAETVSVLADPSPPPRTALPEQLVLGRERYGR